MKGTMDILYCDHEDGCGDWTPDYYAQNVSNWRELLRGWTYNPYKDQDAALCPYHSPEAVAEREAGYPKFWNLLFTDMRLHFPEQLHGIVSCDHDHPQFDTHHPSGHPVGLCGNRSDHAPHVHPSTTLGVFWCEADQTKRLPYAMERKTT